MNIFLGKLNEEQPFELIIFENNLFSEDPIRWPKVDALIAFYSNGIPTYQ